MDSNYLVKTLDFHGSRLYDALKNEQGENAVKALQWKQANRDTTATSLQKNDLDESRHTLLAAFIAKKADMLFKTCRPAETIINSSIELEDKDKYAIIPPLECFTNVESEARKTHFYNSLVKGDVVIGHVTGKHIHGLIITLICLNAGKMRLIDDLNIKCFCHIHHIPHVSAHEDPLDEFNVNDLVQGVVNDFSVEAEKIYITMIETTFAHVTHLHLKLGLITDDDLPPHFKKSSKLSGDSYESAMKKTLGFVNPTIVPQLGLKMGINVKQWPSLMRGLHEKEYPKADYAVELYKTQCSQWAYKSVKQGVDYFKAGNNVEAFQCLNKALQIDPSNVEAFVARGALYANNNGLSRALEDFEKALLIDSNHVNARKFIVTTLIAYGKQLEDDGKIEEAIKNYKKAMVISPSNMEAMQHMKLSQKKLAEQEDTRIRLQEAHNEENRSTDIKNRREQTQSTKERLKQLLSVERVRHDGDKQRDKKWQKSMSPIDLTSTTDSSVSSSTSTTSSTDSSFNYLDKGRKRKNGSSSTSSKIQAKYTAKSSDRKSVDSDTSKRRRSSSFHRKQTSRGEFEKSSDQFSCKLPVSRPQDSFDTESNSGKPSSLVQRRDSSKSTFDTNNTGSNHRVSRQSLSNYSQSSTSSADACQGRFSEISDNGKTSSVASCSKPSLNELEFFLANLKAAKSASLKKISK